MTAQELSEKQEELQRKIEKNAGERGLTREDPFLAPILDGVSDIEGYLASNPKIMWILKEPYDDSENGVPTGGGWSLTEHFKNTEVWKDLDMWKLIIQINYAIRNKKIWNELDYIEKNQSMPDELKKTAYINLSKMPNTTTSSPSYLWECYGHWKDILFEQIDLYKPDIIIFGNTFAYFREDLKMTEEPISQATYGQWTSKAFKKEGILLIEANHPARKGGEDGGYNYVSSIIDVVQKVL